MRPESAPGHTAASHLDSGRQAMRIATLVSRVRLVNPIATCTTHVGVCDFWVMGSPEVARLSGHFARADRPF
jgi:hypothetical protein